MLRRRRPQKNELIHFSFDSFLDLVTNVVGIIIKLILVTWIGARTYHSSMQWIASEPEPPAAQLPAPKASDDPLYSRLEAAKAEMEEAKARLSAQLKQVEDANSRTKDTQAQIIALASRYSILDAESKRLTDEAAKSDQQTRSLALSTDEIRERTKKLLDEIKTLESTPGRKKEFKYHAPLSRAVHIDELFFECKNGRIAFIDLPAFMIEVKRSMEGVSNELKTAWRVDRTTAPVGSFRLRYTTERERSLLDAGPTPSADNFRYGLSEWVVEPTLLERGETVAAALAEGSQFRRLVDSLDSNLTVVTFWVYPDSFDAFRKLRDHLYERGIDVAGRPLPPGAPIAASKNGTASRGQ